MKIVTIKNYITVLENMKKLFEHSDSDDKQTMCDDLNEMLDNQLSNDFFGTEGQRDPRGDQRD
ncbi:MAG: hypothetical protein RLZZ479_1256 [Bacteroidota bacterium]|jgi:hypothetical protein